jgi:hypothetical protein
MGTLPALTLTLGLAALLLSSQTVAKDAHHKMPALSRQFSYGPGKKNTTGSTIGPNGRMLICYFTPTTYFPTSKVPYDLCTHIIYAFGTISSSSPTIENPSQGQMNAWATLTSLRQKNPNLKVMLSLQQGFPNVVRSGTSTMKT